MKHLLALDAGTGSGRAVIFDETGRQVAAVGREWSHPEEEGVPGSMRFDWERNWKLLENCLKEALSQVSDLDLAGVAATSMREAIVLFDHQGNEIWACSNVDARSVEQVIALRKDHPELEEQVYKASGQTYSLAAIARLLWVKERRPDIYEKAASVAMLSDWIAHKLGAPLSIDPSNGGTTGLFNLETRAWDPALARACGIKEELLSAAVHESGEVIGAVGSEASLRTGLPKGLPIVTGGGDAQLGSIGVGAVLAGDCAVFGGSFWQQELNMNRPFEDASRRVRINFHAVPELWQAETIVFYPGIVMRWFRDAVCPDLKQEAARRNISAYALISEMAAQVPPGSKGIIPIFSGPMNYSKWYHAAPSFLNLSVEGNISTRAAMGRSILENAAIVTKANLLRIRDFTGTFPEKIIFAGGGSVDPFWCQILADVLQVPVETRKVKEATALGAAICAGKGTGLYGSFSDGVAAVVRKERLFEPDRGNASVYQETYDRWLKAYTQQLSLVDAGVTTSMWKAPGE